MAQTTSALCNPWVLCNTFKTDISVCTLTVYTGRWLLQLRNWTRNWTERKPLTFWEAKFFSFFFFPSWKLCSERNWGLKHDPVAQQKQDTTTHCLSKMQCLDSEEALLKKTRQNLTQSCWLSDRDFPIKNVIAKKALSTKPKQQNHDKNEVQMKRKKKQYFALPLSITALPWNN